jgi:DNA-binding beta-propeller fold protein YncE
VKVNRLTLTLFQLVLFKEVYMKKAKFSPMFLTALCLLFPTFLFSQWLEQMMYLPDSFGGLSYTTSIYFDGINDKLFLWGGSGSTVVTIDCATDEKIQPIRIDNALRPEPWSFTYNSYNNCLYGLTEYSDEVCSLYAINCQNRQVVATIPIHYPIVSLCANNISNKVYLVGNDSLFIIDTGVYQISRRIGLDMLSNSPPPIYNPRHDVAYIYSEGKFFVLGGVNDSIIDTIFALNFQPRYGNEFLDTLNDRFYVWGWDNSSQPSKILIINCSTNQVVSVIGLDQTVTPYGVDMDIDPINLILFVIPLHGYGQTIWVFNPITGIIEDSICTQFWLYGVKYCATNNRLYVATDYDTILVINPANHQTEYLNLGGFSSNSTFWFLHPLLNKFYIPVSGSSLFVVDVVTNQIIKKLVFGIFQTGGFLWNPINNRFYCTSKGAPYVHCFDASTNQALYTRELPIPGYGLYELAVSTLHNKIYIGFPDGIVVLDGTVDTIIKVIWFSNGVKHLCYNPTSDKIYGTNLPYTCVIDCVSDEIISVINTPYAHRPYCNPRTNKVYVAGDYGMTCIIDGAGDTLLATFVGIGGYAAFRETYELVYLSRVDTLNSLVILDGRTNQVIEYLPNLKSYDVIYNPINDRLYCSNRQNYTLILDCVTNTVIDTLPVPRVVYYNSINNKLYSYDSSSVVVIDGVSNEIIARFDGIGIPDGLYPPIWNGVQNRTYVYFYGQSRVAVIRDEIPGVEERSTLYAERFTPEIYPNPARSFLALRLKQSADRQQIKIFDVSGKLIKEIASATMSPRNDRAVEISLKGINPGIYFLQFGNDVKKFLVVK